MLHTSQKQESQTPSPEKLKRKKFEEGIPLSISMYASTILHVVLPLLFWGLIALILFILLSLGINLKMFNPPEPKMRDLEFKLVSSTPLKKAPKDAKLLSDRNSAAGGKHDPTKPVEEPKPQAQAASKPQPKPQPKAQPKPQPKPQPKNTRPKPQPKQQPKPQQKVTKPQPKVTKPSPKPPAPKLPIPVAKSDKPTLPQSKNAPPINIPIGQKASAPDTSNSDVGPITKSTSSADNSSSSGSSSGPAPITLNSPTSSRTGSGAPGGTASTGSSSYGSSGSPGNPSPGNPSASAGIATRKADFGPYMADLQRRIKRNWAPPKQQQSKRVVLMFTIHKSGRLLGLRVLQSSGDPGTDKAAVSAVQLTAPFRPLPQEFRESQISIQFTFDYNVFGASGSY